MANLSVAADRLNRLDGWQRACLVVALVWLPLVCFLRYPGFPTEERWYSEYRDRSFEVKRELMEEAEKYREHCRKYSDIYDYNNCSQANGPYYKGAVARAQARADEIVSAGQRRIEDNLTLEQQKAVVIAVAMWLGPIVVLYIVGILVGWVVRGFRPS